MEDACSIVFFTKSHELLKIGNLFISCSMELIIASGTHISIEQLSFKSIQHVLKYRIFSKSDEIY